MKNLWQSRLLPLSLRGASFLLSLRGAKPRGNLVLHCHGEEPQATWPSSGGTMPGDYVFHQAAIPSVPRSIENPLATHEVNITGTLNVLLAARDSGVKKVVYASSSSVYGDTPNPQSPYAVTKLAGEYYCQVFHHVLRASHRMNGSIKVRRNLI